ncbi:MAG TPA: hypothetical protein VKR61_06185 [Bryobacteraceae bacterium]|nr:hypothetical protein [Bryobacteraceae bacterium]
MTFIRATFAVFATVVLAGVPANVSPPVTTSQYGPARTGADTNEFTLTPRNVNVSHFGKLAAFPVDGPIYAQPLFLPAVTMPGKGMHDVVFVATEHDSVYAFDAHDGGAAAPLWRVSFLTPGVTPVPAADVECPLISPEVGVTATPVIDVGTGTLYVLARTREHHGVIGGQYVQKLHALAVTTGAEKFGGPVVIRAWTRGRGDGNAHGAILFDARRQNPRAGLLLSQGRIYLTWASSCDAGPYHGWIMAYDAQTLKQTAVFNTSPDANDSGIWQSGTSPAADSDGNIFVVTGNGRFDASAGGHDYGDGILKLHLDQGQLNVRDYFTPFDEKELNANDQDLGSGGPVLLPDQPGLHTHLLLAGGKAGMLYVIDRDRMGGYHPDSDVQAVGKQQFPKHALFGAPAFWNGHVYVVAGGDVLRDLVLRDGKLVLAHTAAGSKYPDAGATPVVSSHGTQDGIVWAVTSYDWQRAGPPAVLHAYDAKDVAHELYTSAQALGRDSAGEALRFAIPLVAGGRVYVGTRRELDVYGLLP